MDLSLEELALLRVDDESLLVTLKHPLPHYQDFLRWNATEFFVGNMSEGGLGAFADDCEGRSPGTAKSWRDVKAELEQILSAQVSRSDARAGLGSRSLSDVEERFREVRKHLDTLFQLVGSLEEQLELAKRQNTALQLLQVDHQSQTEGMVLYFTNVTR